MRKMIIWLVALFCVAPVAAQNVTEAVNSITPDDLRRRIAVIADDSMRGRYTPSPELDQTAAWIGEQFRSFGLKPGGSEGTFVQRYPLKRTQLDLEASRVTVEGGPTWHLGTDTRWWQGMTGGAGVGSSVALVWGALGGTEEVATLPVDGKVVIVVVPTGTRSTGSTASAMLAAVPSAAAAIVVTGEANELWTRQLSRESRMRVSPAWRRNAVAMPVVEVKDGSIAPVLAAHGVSLAETRGEAAGALQSRELAGLSVNVKVVNALEEIVSTPNTVGILEGSDPTLKDEYIVFSAHMDHVGTSDNGSCRLVEGDGICNGADDDASGTIGVVELAEAYAMMNPRPRRSMIFLTVSGEERGLWGSQYFATNPTVPANRIVANLNADMIGRNWTDTVVVIGKEHSDLGATLNEVNARHPELNMTAIDDIWPDQGFYFRSDHYNFARRGIPILFFFTGVHDDYHRPSDELELIDVEKESRIVKLIFHVGLEVANRDERPQWNPESYAEIVRPMP